MAINMLNEDSMVKCPKCGSHLLALNQLFILEKVSTNEGIKYKRKPYKTTYNCANCATDTQVKVQDVLNT